MVYAYSLSYARPRTKDIFLCSKAEPEIFLFMLSFYLLKLLLISEVCKKRVTCEASNDPPTQTKKCLKRSQYSTGGGASEGEIKNIWDWIISFSRGISLSTLEKSIFGNIFKMFPLPFHNLHWRNVSSILPFNAQDFISNSPYCLPYSSYEC